MLALNWKQSRKKKKGGLFIVDCIICRTICQQSS